MNGQNRGDLPHLLVTHTATTEPYKTPLKPRGRALNLPLRYSLLVSIKTPETEVDIYTPVENMITSAVEV